MAFCKGAPGLVIFLFFINLGLDEDESVWKKRGEL